MISIDILLELGYVRDERDFWLTFAAVLGTRYNLWLVL